MSDRLEITTFGGLTILHQGEPVTGLASRKAEALLVYVACAARPRPREVLAELLWDERTQARASSNLRVVLSSLRKQLASFVDITRDSVALNPDAQVWVDATVFEERLDSGHVEEAAALYHGDFLEGYFVRGSRGFEDWLTLERERLRQKVLEALGDLVAIHLKTGRYREGIPHARRLVQLDPYLEEAHCQLMRLQAYSGERGAALTQYETCRRILEEELGVEPMEETTVLFLEIQSGDLVRPAPAPSPEPVIVAETPGFLEALADSKEPARPVFVGRQRELLRLDAMLEAALAGSGQVAYVTGGAGRGKTALAEEFARRAMDSHSELLVAAGRCNAYSGIGDPYLPFREALGMLTGDLEGRWISGSISREHALRQWAAMPSVADALVNHGPHLVDLMLTGQALLSRAAASDAAQASWFQALRAVVERPTETDRLAQDRLFQEFTATLQAVARLHPLVLVLDDMQWADTASISLLFHLGRQLGNARILILIAYRPDEVALGRNRDRHPLEQVLRESKRQFGDVWLDLGEVERGEGRLFVDALLDSESNRLGEGFREALYQHTEGHPLFTVELLRAMQERGDLVRDADQNWAVGAALDWQTLPPRVEGVVEERIGRLDADLRDILLAASVEGEVFTAQVVAGVQEAKVRHVLRALSGDLEKRHRLVKELGELQVRRHRLSRYRFTHSLFQSFLYNSLGAGERRLLHGEIGRALEGLYQEHTDEVAVQLARHFHKADIPEKAVIYLIRAGDQARALYAHDEAERFYLDAIEIQSQGGDDEQAARTLMKLGLVHTAAFEPEQASQAYERAFDLWEPLRESGQVSSVLPPPSVLRFALEEPSTLDPGSIGDDVSTFVASQLYEGLVRIGQDHNVLPAVAARWDVLDGGCRYLFHLREQVCWSDGTPLTAVDFEAAWKRHLHPSSGSSVAHLLYPIRNARALREGEAVDAEQVGVKALDAQTLQVQLEGPTAYLPYLLAQTIAYPLPSWALESQAAAWDAGDKLISNGPYRLAEREPGQQLVMVRNPYYRGRFSGNAERVECAVFAGYSMAMEAYTSGSVDAVSMLNVDQRTVARARSDYGDELVEIPRPSILYLMFRSDRPPFDDVRVRKAFVHAVDREALAKEVFQDYRLPATGGFVPPGMPGHTPGIGLAYNAEEARRLLDEAGYPGGHGFPSVTWLHPSRTRGERVIPFLWHAWQGNLGVDVESRSLEWGEFLDQLGSDPADMTVVSWGADFPDPAGMLRVTFHSKEGVSNPNWEDARFDALVEEAERITDHGRRLDLYREADRILVSEQVVTMPLTYGRGRILVKPWIKLPENLFFPLPFRSLTITGSSRSPK